MLLLWRTNVSKRVQLIRMSKVCASEESDILLEDENVSEIDHIIGICTCPVCKRKATILRKYKRD
jgi:hypothetical protein